ncbi:hypothetical protein Hanom_Chr14g01292761 [Helianthus anomalus]
MIVLIKTLDKHLHSLYKSTPRKQLNNKPTANQMSKHTSKTTSNNTPTKDNW